MKSRALRRPIFLTILISGPAVTLFMTPNISLEPIDQPKMFALVIAAFGVLGAIASKFLDFYRSLNRYFFWLVILFLVQMSVVLLFSKGPFEQQFFGTFGRNTGWLTYFSLAVIAVGASVLKDEVEHSYLVSSLLFTGLISMIYSFMQHTGNDPIKWNNPHNSIIGFVGNPDFQSSLLGMCSVAAVSLVLQNGRSAGTRIAALIYVMSGVSLVFMTHALQGLLIFALGSTFIIYANLKFYKTFNKRYIKYVFFLSVSIIGTTVVLGTLKIGPLAHALYKISVRQRGYYWRAAVQMANHNPFFGVGLDGYGNWYMKYRSASAALNSKPTQSNAAHNVYLDMAATGGWLLFLLHLALFILAIWFGIRTVKNLEVYNWSYIAIVGALIAYAAQALVSINQIGLAVWGWILLGLTFSVSRLENSSRENALNAGNHRGKVSKRRNIKKSNSILIATFIGLLVGFLFVFPYFNNDAKFRSATNSGSAQQVVSAALASPRDNDRTFQAAQILQSSNLKSEANRLLDVVLESNPRLLNAWYMKYQVTEIGSPAHELAKNRLNELNPRDPVK